MVHVTYEVVEHDGGWAYKVGDVFSETFPSHEEARQAADRAAAEHEQRGSAEPIEYQDAEGKWHEETSPVAAIRPASKLDTRINPRRLSLRRV